MRSEYCSNDLWHPHDVYIPDELYPNLRLSAQNGILVLTDDRNCESQISLAEVTRNVLANAKTTEIIGESWVDDTRRKFFTYDIVYIGKSYGSKGARTVADRLGAGHKHLQEVLAHIHDYFEGASVGVMALNIEFNRQAIRGRITASDLDQAAAGATFKIKGDSPFSDEGKLVDTAEAALIGLFDPRENTQNKKFPNNPRSEIVINLKGADVNEIMLDLDLTDSHCYIKNPVSGQPARCLKLSSAIPPASDPAER